MREFGGKRVTLLAGRYNRASREQAASSRADTDDTARDGTAQGLERWRSNRPRSTRSACTHRIAATREALHAPRALSPYAADHRPH